MTRLLDLIARLQRPPGVVAWGGRPGIDYQLGSHADRHRADYLAHRARLDRERIRRLTEAMRASLPSMLQAQRAIGVAFGTFAADVTRAMRAFQRAGLTVEAIERERRRRDALSRAASRAAAETRARDALRGKR